MPRFDPQAALRRPGQLDFRGGGAYDGDDTPNESPGGLGSPRASSSGPGFGLSPGGGGGGGTLRRSTKRLTADALLSPRERRNAADARREEQRQQEIVDRLSGSAEYVQSRREQPFDPATYLACKRYIKRHEATRLAAQHLRDSDMIPSSEFAVMSWGEKVHSVLLEPFRSRAGRVLLVLEAVLIVLTLAAIVVESMPSYQPDIHPAQSDSWLILDGVISNLFLLELVVTVVTFPPPRRRIIISARSFIDAVSIAPFYVQLLFSRDQRNILGLLKALRVLRLGKLLLLVDSFLVIVLAMKKSVKMLVAPLTGLLMVMVTISAAVYYSERGDFDDVGKRFLIDDCQCQSTSEFVLGKKFCPKVEARFNSIPDTMWFMAQTITTVGYGAPLPICEWGMAFSVVAMFFGSLALSMPIAVVGSYYSLLEFEKQERVKELRRTLTRTGTGGSSFATLSSDHREGTGAIENLTRLVKAEAAAGPKSPAEGLVRFLSEHVKSAARPKPTRARNQYQIDGAMPTDDLDAPKSALSYFNLYHPNPEVLTYLDTYLSDFAEELHLRGRSAPAPPEVGHLVPASSLARPKTGAGALPHTQDASATVAVSAVKNEAVFDVCLHERLGDDTLSADASRRAQIRATGVALRQAERRRTKRAAAVDIPDGLAHKQTFFYPGVYSSIRVARVALQHVHRSVLESEGDPATHASIRGPGGGGGGDGRDRIRRVVIQFPRPLVSMTSNLASPDRITAALPTHYVAEPYTRRKKGNAVPSLAAHTWHMAHTSAVYGAAGGHAGDAALGAAFGGAGALERNLFPGNVVTLQGIAYQYRCDDADMTSVFKAFECALFDLRRQKLSKVSGTLYGMPVDGVTQKDTAADPLAAGATVGNGKARSPPRRHGGSPHQSLRRRGRSPSPLLNGDPTDPEYVELSAVSGPNSAVAAADALRRAHATADGELLSPFMSSVAAQSGRRSTAESSAAAQKVVEKRRKERLGKFSRDPHVGL